MNTYSLANPTNDYYFKGEGEMSRLVRDFDWSGTSIGSPQNWPESLRTIVGIILSSRFPMFLWWGSDLIQFYNDAYRPSLGQNGKHPQALGSKGKDTWHEIWPTICPLINQVMEEEKSIWSEDQLIPIYRNGHIEDVYWTFSYSPVLNQEGRVGGVSVVCSETTDKVRYNENIKHLNSRLNRSNKNLTALNQSLFNSQGDLSLTPNQLKSGEEKF